MRFERLSTVLRSLDKRTFMFGRGFFGGAPWGTPQLRPTARLAGPRMAQATPCCKVPETELRPCFDMNWNATGLCGNTWMNTSNEEFPECTPAPEDYKGLPFTAPDGSKWLPLQCGAAAPTELPPPQLPPPSVPPSAPPPTAPPTLPPVSPPYYAPPTPGAPVIVKPRPFPTLPQPSPVRMKPEQVFSTG